MAETVLQDHYPRDKPRDGCLPDRVSAAVFRHLTQGSSRHSHTCHSLRGHVSLYMSTICRTILELVRDMATDLVADGARVKVCVQQALGQGVFQV